MTTEVHEFKADINELLNLIINAFYSSKEVFLRELISNASDALDKQRFSDLASQVLDKVYEIKLTTDKEQKVLVIEDNGVGMTKEDLVDHLSTIAKSGTKDFVKQLTEKSDMIGQFGVGFYSSYLVADSVDVVTRKQGSPTYKWTSDATQSFSISEIEDETFTTSGTKIILHMKEDASEFLDEDTIRRIISTHSQFITYPIRLLVDKEYEVPIEEEEAVVETDAEEVESKVVEEDIDDDKTVAGEEEKPKTRKETRQEWADVNGEKPLWYHKPNEPTVEEYNSLYKVISKDYSDPLHYRHFSTEGNFEFKGILYIPSHAPFMNDFSKDKRNIRLYVKKVMVLQHLDKDIMPDWMNFVTGVIDSSDMPLNVSREMLQQTKVLNAMKSQIKKQVMNMLTDLMDDKEKYTKFYDAFRKNIKLGIHEGNDNLLDFLRIRCNKKDNVISLEEYIEGVKEGQKSIYYITGENSEKSVFTKMYQDRGYSVLLLDEAIDEFMMQRVTRYKDFEFVNIAKEHKCPWDTEDDQSEETSETIKEFCDWFKTTLSDQNVDSVKISKTLSTADDTACIVVSSKYGWTGNMEKLMMAQPLGDNNYMSMMKGKKLVEINKNHPIIEKLLSSYKSEDGTDTKTVNILYQSSLVSAGFPIDNPDEFSRLVQSMLTV